MIRLNKKPSHKMILSNFNPSVLENSTAFYNLPSKMLLKYLLKILRLNINNCKDKGRNKSEDNYN